MYGALIKFPQILENDSGQFMERLTTSFQYSIELLNYKETLEAPFQGAKAKPAPLAPDSLLLDKNDVP